MIHRIRMTWPVVSAVLISISHAALSLASEAGAAETGGGNRPDPLAFKGDLMLWTAIVFVLLLIVLKKYAWKPIMDGLEKREGRIAGEIAGAEQANAQAQALLAQYQSQLSTAEEKVRQIVEQGRADAEAQSRAIVEAAREQSEQEQRRARQEIDQATTAALQQLAEKSADLAVDLAGRIVKTKITEHEQKELVGEAMDRFSVRQ
ncbi:MAG: F0F1 ATP synthase subunit B [Planctomycetia bacterium]|nr:F0F1 ATP synthase subunit B [Planctomycetia bacterium]